MPRDLPLQKLKRPGSRTGNPPRLEFSASPPYWDYADPPYEAPWRDDEGRYGDELPDRSWLVLYPADYLPDASDPVWTEFLSGPVVHAVAGSIFTITDTLGAAGYLYYEYDLPVLNTTQGAVVEARVKIVASDGGENQGAALSLFDGAYQYAVWMRLAGINLDGAANVAADMSTFRLVRLTTQGGYCHLYLDGEHQQGAPYMNPTAEKKIVFGTWVEL